jgi:carotenoid 1,2-hydratase
MPDAHALPLGIPAAGIPGAVTPGLARDAFDPGFQRPVAEGGYVWWYMDALSDCGRYGLTVIFFIGSVFSPYYALARRRGRGDPRAHCAVNVVLTGPGADRWCMTERGSSQLAASARRLHVGPSLLSWDGRAVTLEIEEMAVPLPRRVRGQVRLEPAGLTGFRPTLDAHGRHRWWPIAPVSRVTVAFDRPGLSWSGPGYFDSNDGDEPLEAGFRDWDWCRAPLPGPDGEEAAILYNVNRRDGSRDAIAVRIGRDGTATRFEPPPPAPLAPCRWWRMPRGTRCEPGGEARVLETLVDAPFYARSVVGTRLLGRDVRAMHENVSLDRFALPAVQAMLPFRMPRRG